MVAIDQNTPNFYKLNALIDAYPNAKHIIRAETATSQLFYPINEISSVFSGPEADHGEPATVCYHEVIRGDRPQRLRFDIDLKTSEEEVDINEILYDIIYAIVSAFYELYYVDLAESIDYSDIVITTSSDHTKHSFHIIVLNYYVLNNEEAKEFALTVSNALPEYINKIIDKAVYNKTQSFRVFGSAKCGTTRYKRQNAELSEMLGTRYLSESELKKYNYLLIESPNGKLLPRICDALETTETEASEDIILKALELSKEITAGHEFVKNIGNLLCFRRISPTRCRICEETHSRDNSLMLYIRNGKLYECCKQRKKKSILIGVVGEIVASDVPFIDRAISGDLQFIHTPDIVTGANYHIYSESRMRPYELTDTLFVRAPMKIGKSKALREYLTAYYGDQSKIRIISFRQTFGKALAADLPGFALYSDVTNGPLNYYSKLIIQVESIHRIARPETDIDLVVLDESESILEQFSSGLHKNFNSSWAIFEFMIKKAAHVVCMDANLSEATINTIKSIRYGGIEKYIPEIIHWNQYQNAADDHYYFTGDHLQWLSRLFVMLENNKRIVIPTNSLIEGKTLVDSISARFPNKVVRIYSSETSNSIKNSHFADVARYWSELDVLIYTPTCSAGVSFEVEHFDALFGAFSDGSCTVETCRQMMGRVRILKTREHYIYLSGQTRFLPVHVDEIKKQLKTERSALFRECGGSIVPWHYNENGEIKFYESEYFKLWTETARLRNLSKNNFAVRFVEQVRETGARILKLDEIPSEEFKLLFTKCKTAIKQKANEEIAAAPKLSKQNIDELFEKSSKSEDITPVEQAAIKQYLLLDIYNMPADFVPDIEFIKHYDNASIKYIYKSLEVFNGAPTANEALTQLQLRELSTHTTALKFTGSFAATAEHVDLVSKYRYMYVKHDLVRTLLKLCGFELFDPEPNCELFRFIETNFKQISIKHIEIEKTFSLAHMDIPLGDCIKALKFVNRVVKKHYGMEIKEREFSMYKVHILEWTDIKINFVTNLTKNINPRWPTIQTAFNLQPLDFEKVLSRLRSISN